MQVVFRGDPVELERGDSLSRVSLDLWGKHFPMNQAVDVSDLSVAQQQKLSRNPHFEVLETYAFEGVAGGAAVEVTLPPAPTAKGRKARAEAPSEE